MRSLSCRNTSEDEFLTQLRERLAADPDLKMSDAEQADAALKISVSPASRAPVIRV